MERRRSLNDPDADADDDEAGRTSSIMERRLGETYSASALAGKSCAQSFTAVFIDDERVYDGSARIKNIGSVDSRSCQYLQRRFVCTRVVVYQCGVSIPQAYPRKYLMTHCW